MNETSPKTAPRVDRIGVILFLITLALGLTFDLVSKHLAFENPSTRLHDGLFRDEVAGVWHVIGADDHEVRLIPGYLHLRLTVNEGAVFGLGQGRQFVFIIVSILASAMLLFMLWRSGRSRFEQIVLGILLAGVLGNLYDRAAYNYVRDMIYVLHDWGVFPWIFNLADSYLCVGVALLIARSFWPQRSKEPAARGTAAEST